MCVVTLKRTTWYVNGIYFKNVTHINCSVVLCTRNCCYTNIKHASQFKCTCRLCEECELEGCSPGRISMSLSSLLFPVIYCNKFFIINISGSHYMAYASWCSTLVPVLLELYLSFRSELSTSYSGIDSVFNMMMIVLGNRIYLLICY